MGRWLVFAYCVFVLLTLVALALLYVDGRLDSIIPDDVPRSVIAAAWAGALGGIAISFRGVFKYSQDGASEPAERQKHEGEHVQGRWDNEWIPWHLGRPFTGVIVGIFVFIALKAVYPTAEPSEATLAAAAFVLGTQDSAFFRFVRQIGAVVVNDNVEGDGRRDTKTQQAQ